jgi:hypothetical protein
MRLQVRVFITLAEEAVRQLTFKAAKHSAMALMVVGMAGNQILVLPLSMASLVPRIPVVAVAVRPNFPTADQVGLEEVALEDQELLFSDIQADSQSQLVLV